jgi:hypothetical protein
MDNAVKIKGFFRLQIEDGPSGEIVGDSGWVENQVTNLGFKLYVADNIGKSSGSKQIAYVALGTGAAPAAGATTLPGEIMDSTQRTGVTYANVASTTAQFTAIFASSDNFLSAAANLSNIGLFATTTTSDTIFAGNAYTSSSCDTNQNVNLTYQIRFS